MADEIFFTGTAAEVTPVRSVDRIQVGAGKRGRSREVAEDVLRFGEGLREDRYGG
jgi:branched-chain amino acid aminotransferase